MRIGELAAKSGVSPRALRHYEKRGLLHSSREENGYRTYESEALVRVRNIRILLDAGLSLDNIRELNACLEEDLARIGTCSEAVALYERRLSTVQEQLAALNEVASRLTEKLDLLRAHAATGAVERRTA